MREGPIYFGVMLLLSASALLAHATEDAAPTPTLTQLAEGAQARRIVSSTLSTDEMLLAIAPIQHLVALSTFADDPLASNVIEPARQVGPRVRGDAETILALSPDLVVTNPYARPEATLLLARSEVPVLTVAPATDLEGIEANLRVLGEALSRQASAEAVIEEMRRVLAGVRHRVRDRERPRVLLYNRSGYVPGEATLFDALLTIAGGANAAREIGIEGHAMITDERLLALDPDVILVVTYVADGRARPVVPDTGFADSPVNRGLTAVRSGRVYDVSPARILSASHHVAEGALELAEILHPEASARGPTP